MSGDPSLPRLVELLVTRLAPRRWHEALLGDLAEEAHRRTARRGRALSSLGLAREALASVASLVAAELRRRFGPPFSPTASEPGDGLVSTLWQDLRYGLRSIRHAPGFATLVVLTFALGIGAATVIWSVVDGVVLRPFPFPEPDRLVGVGSAYPRLDRELGFWENLSAPEILDVAEQSRSLEGVVA